MNKVLAHSLTAIISSASTLGVVGMAAIAHLYGVKFILGCIAVLGTIVKLLS